VNDVGPPTNVKLPDEWARLHPLSPIVHAGRAAVGLGSLAALNAASQGSRPHWDALIAVVIAMSVGTVYWRFTKWRVVGGELQIDTGLFRRQQVRVPLTRIQGIDLNRPLLARALGLSELRLVLAGHSTGRARLSYLPEERAIEVRARLIALAHGLDATTPEAPERPLLAVTGRRIVFAHLLTARFALWLLALIVVVNAIAIKPRLAGPLIGPAVIVLFTLLLVTWRLITAEWEFRVAEAPDGLRLRGGLLQTRSETIRHGRVQAVRWIEPLLWRPFGWVRLECDIARRRNKQGGEDQAAATTIALLPVGSREEARWMLSRTLPGAVAELPATAGLPRRARWRVPLSRRYARMAHDATYVSCSTGRFRPDVVVVPLEKVQSIRIEQGPWSRRLQLASVLIDTAGQRFTGSVRWRDEREAQRLVETLPDLARAARVRAATAANAAT
jgi:putative membrane protein